MGSTEQHRKLAADQGPIHIALITVSDTRTSDSDENGKYLREQTEAAGNLVKLQTIVPDDPDRVLGALQDALSAGCSAVILNGGTGISRRDTTYDAIAGRLEKTLPGFGELFRMLSWNQIGAAAMLSRAVAGVIGGCVVISIPGSPAAVRLAWEELIRPELAHMVRELSR